MSKKTIITIIIVVVILIAISAGLVLYSSRVQNSQNSMPEQTSNINAISNKTPNLPTGSSENKAMQVEDVNNSNQVKNSYNNYVGQDYTNLRYVEQDGISEPYTPADKNVNLVPLDSFLSSIGANINSKVKSIAGKNYYGLFYCINEKKQKEYGLALDLSDKDPTKAKENFDSAGDAMVTWEPYILKDMHNILFPSNGSDKLDINQTLTFKDGKYRYAEINLPDGKSSINYKVIGSPLNMIIITTSQNCLDKAVGLFSALD